MAERDLVLTRTGYDEIQRELSEILTVKRPEVIERIREARQVGNLTENYDYEDAKRLQAMLDARVKELKAILAHASIVDSTKRNGDIDIGAEVTVRDVEEGVEDHYTIVGFTESSPAEGRISHQSSVGSALMGKKAGDTVLVYAPGGVIKYEIVSVK